ncbi:15931_t:CDS:2, partial [Racocetra persica]
ELDLAGCKLYCCVLEDGTRGLSKRGTQEVLGIVDKNGKQKYSANRLGEFLNQKSLQPFIYKGKEVGNFDPIVCYDENDVENHIFKAATLIDIADVRSVAKVGIDALVDEATGYQKVREETLQEILRLYVSEEKKPLFVGYLTIKLIYENLPEGVLEKIKEKTPKTKGGHWRYRFHQSLTIEIGREALKKVIYTIETLAKISKDKNQFLRLVKKVYHPKKDLPFYIDVEAMNERKEEDKVDKLLGALLKTPKPKKDE